MATRNTPADETSGFPSRELGIDPFTRRPGSNQWLGHDAAHHDDYLPIAPRGNQLQAGRHIGTAGPSIGPGDAVNPAGRRSDGTLQDEGTNPDAVTAQGIGLTARGADPDAPARFLASAQGR